jgi:hypothetical protein
MKKSLLFFSIILLFLCFVPHAYAKNETPLPEAVDGPVSTAVPQPDLPKLTSLAVSDGVLCPSFTPDTLKYDIYLYESENEFSLDYTAAQDAAAEIKSNGA